MDISNWIGRLRSRFSGTSQANTEATSAPANNPRPSLRRASYDLGVEAGAVVKALYEAKQISEDWDDPRLIYPVTPEISSLRERCRTLVSAGEFHPRAFSAGFKTTSIDSEGYGKYEDYGYDIFEIYAAGWERLQAVGRLKPTEGGHFVVDYNS